MTFLIGVGVGLVIMFVVAWLYLFWTFKDFWG